MKWSKWVKNPKQVNKIGIIKEGQVNAPEHSSQQEHGSLPGFEHLSNFVSSVFQMHQHSPGKKQWKDFRFVKQLPELVTCEREKVPNYDFLLHRNQAADLQITF